MNISKLWVGLAVLQMVLSQWACGTNVRREKSDIEGLLSREYESVVGVSARMIESLSGDNIHRAEMNVFLMPFSPLFLGLNGLDEHLAGALLNSADYVVMGATHFRAPVNTGRYHFDFCYVFALGANRPVGRLGRNEPDALGANGQGGVREWSVRMAPDDGEPTTLFAQHVGRMWVAISNERGRLEKVVHGLEDMGDTRFSGSWYMEPWLPRGSNALWAYRHYSRASGSSAGMLNEGSATDGATFALTYIAGSNECVLRIIGVDGALGPDDIVRGARDLPPFTKSGSTWVLHVPLNGDELTLTQMASIMSILGFGLAL